MQTIEHATAMADMAVEILFSAGDPFNGKVDRPRLQENIKQATLKKLVTEDSDFLEEAEFQACVEAAKISLN